MKQDEGRFQGANGLSLFRQSWLPDGEAHASLALVHGIGEHSGRYPALVEHLTGRGVGVHSFDLRGHGRSPGKRGHVRSWDDYREDIRLFVAYAREQGKPVVLMGHSLGGLMVLNYAIVYPQGLAGVIASAPALAQNGASPLIITLARVLSRVKPEITLPTGLDTNAISRKTEVVQAYRDDPLVHGVASARFADEMVQTMAWTNAHAADFSLPLLILHGTADQIVPAEASRVFFDQVSSKQKKRLEYADGFHESHNDLHAAQAVKDVGDWLEGLVPPGA